MVAQAETPSQAARKRRVKKPPPRYSIITPSTGLRPNALGLAIDSVEAARRHAGLAEDAVEMLVGFDGVRGARVREATFVRWFDFPRDGDFGNAIRNGLIRAARGKRLLFLDDDNALTPEAFVIHEAHADVEMVVARVDTSRAFDVSHIPRTGSDIMQPGNVDPLCLCLDRELVLTRCGGWTGSPDTGHDSGQRAFRYESDFVNMRHYWRRARSRAVVEAVVGVYDAGSGLDPQGMNTRQTARATQGADTAEKT